MTRLASSLKTIAASAAAVVFVGLLSSTSGAAGENTKKVRLAYAGWEVGTAVAYVGIDAGIFKKYDLEIEEIFIRDALSGGIQSLIGVDLVLGFGNPLAILRPILEGADIVSLGSHVSIEKHGMAVTAEVATVKELKGKKIGISALGGRSDLIARVILRRAGLDPVKDVEVVLAGLAPNRVAALSKKLIQGAPLSTRFMSQAESLGLRVLEVRDVPLVTGLLMTSRSFINRDTEAVRRFVKGYLAAIHYYLTRRNESIAIIKKYFTASNPDALESMYEAFAAQLTPLPVPNREAVQAIIDAAAVADKRAQNIKPPDLFEPRFLDELKASGFLEELYTEKISL